MVPILILMLLSGCAADNYSPTSQGNGSQTNLKSDLYDCKIQVNHEYFSQKSDLSQVFIGGLISPVISEVDDSKIKIGDLNKNVEKCMLKKGYIGTSN